MVTPGPFKLMTPNVFCQSILSMRKSLYSYGFGSLYWPLSHSLTLSSTWCEYNIRIHQILSPIYKSGSTNFLKEYFFWFLFQLVNWEKKTVFMTNKKFVSFFNGSNWETFVEKIREINWWKHLMSSLSYTMTLSRGQQKAKKKCNNSCSCPNCTAQLVFDPRLSLLASGIHIS